MSQVQVPAVSTVGALCLPVSFRLSLLPGQGRTERVFYLARVHVGE